MVGATVQVVSHRTTILVLALLSQSATSLVQFGLPALFFALRDEFGIGPARFGLIFAAIGIGSGLMLAVAGRLCDRLGARPVLVAGSIVGALGPADRPASRPTRRCSASALFIAGIGGAAVPVAGMTTLLRVFPPEQRGMVMGLRQMAVPAGGVIAAGLLPLLAHLGGLRLAFGVPAVLVLVSGLAFAAVSGPGRARPRPGREPAGRCRPACRGCSWSAASTSPRSAACSPSRRRRPRTRASAPPRPAIVLALLNVGAGVARVVWGRVADREHGTRRVRTLIDVGLVGTVAALAFPLLVHGGPVVAAASALALAFGVLGFNGIVYLIAGELGGPQRAGAAVGLASTVVFSVGSIVGPRVRAAGRAGRLHDDVPGRRRLHARRRGGRARPGGAGARGPRRRGLTPARPPRVYPSAVPARPERGSEVELVIGSLAFGGRGVARLDDFVLFVDRALPGDRVRARVTKVKRRYGDAVTVETLEKGPDRVEAPCPHFGACGGCRWQDLAYEAQLRHKTSQVRDALERIGHQTDFVLDPIEPAVSIFDYRNKVEFTFTAGPDGHGARLPPRRPLGPGAAARASACWSATPSTARAARSRRGPRRPACCRSTSARTRATCATSSSAAPSARASSCSSWSPRRASCGAATSSSRSWPRPCPSASACCTPSPSGWPRSRPGCRRRSISGRDWFAEELLGLRLRVSAGAFLQTNTAMCERLYELAHRGGGR